MLEELILIRNAFLRLLAAFIVLTLGFLAIPLPGLGMPTTEVFIEIIRTRLLPAGSTLAVTNPLDPFLNQATIAATFAVALMLPLLFWEFWHFVAPGLEKRERTALVAGLVASLGLAALGAAFAYFVLIPLMFTELYAFLPAGVVAYFSLSEVVSLVSSFMIGCALVFLLPLAMVILSFIGLVPPGVWLAHVRMAVLLVLIVSAIITPDGSGAGMILLSVPVCALYGLGYAASAFLVKRKKALLVN